MNILEKMEFNINKAHTDRRAFMVQPETAEQARDKLIELNEIVSGLANVPCDHSLWDEELDTTDCGECLYCRCRKAKL